MWRGLVHFTLPELRWSVMQAKPLRLFFPVGHASLYGLREPFVRLKSVSQAFGVSDHEGDFRFVRPGDPIPRSSDSRHSEINSDKPDQGDLTDKIAIHERREFFVGQDQTRT
jgi:hypothetical protein